MGILALTAGCARAQKEGSTVVRIQAPDAAAFYKAGVNTMAFMPRGRKACFAVNVTGGEIATRGGACTPKLGEVVGFTESGGTLEMELARGTDRKFEIYMYLLPTGDTSPCPVVGDKSLNAARITSTYLLGAVDGVTLANDVETIRIPVAFPGVRSHIGMRFQMPTTCLAQNIPSTKVGFNVTSSEGTATGGGLRMKARLGGKPASTATGGNIRLNGTVH